MMNNSHFMKFLRLLILCTLTSSVLALPACDDSKKKEEQTREENTKRSLKGNAGAYTPAPIDMSMGTPTPTPTVDKP